MNALKKLADIFSKTEKTAPAKETTPLLDPYREAREHDEGNFIKALPADKLAELKKPVLNGREFLQSVNHLLMEAGAHRGVSWEDVKTYNVFTANGCFKEAVLAVRRTYGYIYAAVQDTTIRFSDGTDISFDPAENFRIYLPTKKNPRPFAVCKYMNGQIMVTCMFAEHEDPSGLSCSPIKTGYWFPWPLADILLKNDL